jgi:hypothetical protein
MVDALECDYDRLEELQDERQDLVDALREAEVAEADDDTPDEDRDELETATACARRELSEWDSDNRTELDDLTDAAGEFCSADDARERIQEDPLSVLVRGDWHEPGTEDDGPAEFEILLCTGGPACRIRGQLDEHQEPCRAWLEHQDWGTPWTEHVTVGEDNEALLAYCRCFYFGN